MQPPLRRGLLAQPGSGNPDLALQTIIDSDPAFLLHRLAPVIGQVSHAEHVLAIRERSASKSEAKT